MTGRVRRRDWITWLTFLLGVTGIGVVAWAFATEWGGIMHGHPAYLVWLGVTLIASVLTLLVGLRRRRRGGLRATGRIVLIVLGIAWLATTAWLRPHTATEPALAAMTSNSEVTVTETATQIVIKPTHGWNGTGVFFQPGALVDPRAYAAHLRPLAADGETVVITKQPLGIAFLAVGAFDDARTSFPAITGWVVGGHSLGGTVASIEADADDSVTSHPAIGLMLYASYPADDISTSLTVPVLSISGSEDGLATPAKIAASRANLPPGTTFVQIHGACHAQFGAYGPQPGDGTPTISATSARTQITAASRHFIDTLHH